MEKIKLEDQVNFTREFFQTFKEEIKLLLAKLVPRIEKKRTIPNSFFKLV